MRAELAAGVGRTRRWEPFVWCLTVCSRRNTSGYLEPFCGCSWSLRSAREARGWVPGAGPGLQLVPGHLHTFLVHGLWKWVGVGVVQSAGRTPSDPEQVRDLLSPGSGRPRWAHIALLLWDRGQLPAVGWSQCPPRRKEITSIIPKIPGFSRGWSGSWEEKGGRPRGEFVVAARPARLRRGGLADASSFSYLPVALRRPPAFLCYAGMGGIPLLEVMSSLMKMGRFPHQRSTSCQAGGKSLPTLLPRKDNYTQVAQVLIKPPGPSGDIPPNLGKKGSWRWVVGWETISSLTCHLPLLGKEKEKPSCQRRCLLLKLTRQIEQAF